jgi:hypothetical protein
MAARARILVSQSTKLDLGEREQRLAITGRRLPLLWARRPKARRAHSRKRAEGSTLTIAAA